MRVCGLAMTPRIILMTDGEPTDSAGSMEVHNSKIMDTLMLANSETRLVCFKCESALNSMFIV